ncbi:MAG: extensin [Rhizobiales bacterium]|nr:extensin [Hyphomicrobiales bacterium]
MRISVAALALVLSGSVAMAASVPLPRPRPAGIGQTGPLPSARPAAPGTVAVPAAKPSACQLSLQAIAVFSPEPPMKGAGQCGIADPVRLVAVILPDQARVAVHPPAALRCEMAAAVTHWIRDDMAPVAAKLGAPLRGIENFDSYDCRGRNRVFGARMSEHGRGNAIDIRAVKLDSGAITYLTDPHVAETVRNELRRSACGRFMTVLGPGSDGYHENHIHLDLAERRSGYRLCQWEVRQPLDRASPSPHIAESRTPTPLEAMPSGSAAPPSDRTPMPRPRRAAERR